MVLLCYSKCSTCKATILELEKAGISFESRDIKEDNPTFEELKQWYHNSGLPLKRFFNTSGQIYRSMELKDKLGNMSEEKQLKLLSTDGMLVKRPMMIDKNSVVIGKKDILNHYGG